MKNWLKEIIRSVIKEEIFNCPLIISSRAPTEHDVYSRGTTWLNGNERYISTEVKAKWKKL